MLNLLFFSGNYCPACKAMYPIIESIEKEFMNAISIKTINVEDDSIDTINYNITTIPTIIFEKNNEQIERLVGPQIKSKLIKIISVNK